PVNASPASLRMQVHDSEPKWCATPFLCGSLIRYSIPVYLGASLITLSAVANTLGGIVKPICFAVAAPAELSIPVLLDEKSTVVPVRLDGEQSGGKRKVSYGDARSNSERAAPSACVGRRLSAPQIVWNRSTRRSGARGGPRVDRPRWLRILTITGGSSIAA